MFNRLVATIAIVLPNILLWVALRARIWIKWKAVLLELLRVVDAVELVLNVAALFTVIHDLMPACAIRNDVVSAHAMRSGYLRWKFPRWLPARLEANTWGL